MLPTSSKAMLTVHGRWWAKSQSTAYARLFDTQTNTLDCSLLHSANRAPKSTAVHQKFEGRTDGQTDGRVLFWPKIIEKLHSFQIRDF